MKISFFSDIFNTGEQGARSRPDLVFADIDEYNRELAKRYVGFRSQRSAFLGWYELRDVAVADHWGIVYDPESRVTPVLLPGFGWQREHLEYAANKGNITIEENLPANVAVGPVIRSHVGPTEIIETEPLYLLSWPGALTFGHWITDVIGRIELSRRHAGERPCRYLSAGPFHPWMQRFFGLYGITQDRLLLLDKSVTYRCSELIVPTIMCHMSGGTLPVEFLKPVFAAHRGAIAPWLPAKNPQDVVFLRHTRMTSAADRELTNIAELTALIEGMGGVVIDPLKTPPGEVVSAIDGARVVVGQDSSALHNVAFAKPVGLLVIESQPRVNLLHASLQEITGGRISYFRAGQSEHGWTVDVARLAEHLERFRQLLA
ncbi:MAG TPA: glycosyltransferase 61 family protein [Stellaceae bacterium]|nr:glycosyltransferase 61 family protein [Stellaceae bacterium]